MESLPLDTSHPAVRDYLSLVRLQVLTPLSLLINIAALTVCAFVVNPSIAGVARLYPTAITPNSGVVGAYVGVIFLGQIGYCLLLVVASKVETKRALVKGVGLSLVFANMVMALWAIAWIMQWFLLATILQGLLLLLLLFSNMALLIYHPPVSARPLDTALIHAPLRFFLILPLSILFPLCLFVTLHLTFRPTVPGPPQDYASWHATAGLGVLIGTNLLGFVVVVARRDIVWCVAATWIAASLWSARPKPAPIYISAILFTVLHPLGLLMSFIYARFYGPQRRGAVVLPPDDEHPGLYHHSAAHPRPAGVTAARPEIERGPREIEDETWGSG
ncbi:hypothetical protein B0H34DRAFT_662501 [Crassisporium funariophilum]|nr:hypothetical protein B0H34DRAFT_662501 [Crassisporium funariophilum]